MLAEEMQRTCRQDRKQMKAWMGNVNALGNVLFGINCPVLGNLLLFVSQIQV